MTRRLPDNPHPVPAVISGYPIIKYERVPAHHDEVPDLAIMLGRDIGRREEVGYAVWDAAVRNGAWALYSMRGDMSLAEAQDYFEQRTRERGVT